MSQINFLSAVLLYYLLRLEFLQKLFFQLISPPNVLMPDWENKLFPNFGDSISRIKWRSKQNLDMKYLMNYMIKNYDPSYFLMMEDDVAPADEYDRLILKVKLRGWFEPESCYILVMYIYYTFIRITYADSNRRYKKFY